LDSTNDGRAAAGGKGFFQKSVYSMGNFVPGVVSGLISNWLMYYYCPPTDQARPLYLLPATYGLLMFLLQIPSALADPTVGHFSDRTRSRWGRRIPYILFGVPFLALSFTLMWFPPVKATSAANAVWLVVTVFIYFMSFTVVINPYLAIMPEVWRTEKDRLTLSALMSVTSGIGMLLSFAAGAVIEALAAGFMLFGFHLNGYTLTAILGGVIAVIFLAPTVIWIHETPHTEEKEVPFNILRSGWETLKNPAFLPYIVATSLLATSTAIVLAMMPYQVTVIAKSTEAMAGIMMAILMVVAMILFAPINKLADRIPRYKMYLYGCLGFGIGLPLLYFGDKIPWIPPLIFMGIIMIVMAPFVSIFLLIPRTLLADIMDFDSQITGYRREAMYNGMEGLIAKIAQGLAPLIMGGLFTWFGNTAQNPMGIKLCSVAAGGLSIIAFIAFTFYPLKKPK